MAPGYAPVGEMGNSGLAITSLVCGILGLFGICPFTFDITAIASIVAIICGHIALSQIKKSGGMLQGKGMAIAGLIMGYLVVGGTVLFILILLAASAPGSVTN